MPKLKAKALLGTDTGGDMLSTFLSKVQVQPSPVRETKLQKRQRVERENVADRAGRQDGAQATPINGGGGHLRTDFHSRWSKLKTIYSQYQLRMVRYYLVRGCRFEEVDC